MFKKMDKRWYIQGYGPCDILPSNQIFKPQDMALELHDDSDT